MSELLFWEPADEAMAQLFRDPSRSRVLAAVNRTLDRLEVDPYAQSLHNRAFQTAEFGGVNATSVGEDDWYVIWQAPEGVVEIVNIVELAL